MSRKKATLNLKTTCGTVKEAVYPKWWKDCTSFHKSKLAEYSLSFLLHLTVQEKHVRVLEYTVDDLPKVFYSSAGAKEYQLFTILVVP